MSYKPGILLLHIGFDFYPTEIKSINTKRINKLQHSHTMEYHINNENQQTTTICNNMDDSQKHNTDQEKSNMKEYMY